MTTKCFRRRSVSWKRQQGFSNMVSIVAIVVPVLFGIVGLAILAWLVVVATEFVKINPRVQKMLDCRAFSCTGQAGRGQFHITSEGCRRRSHSNCILDSHLSADDHLSNHSDCIPAPRHPVVLPATTSPLGSDEYFVACYQASDIERLSPLSSC